MNNILLIMNKKRTDINRSAFLLLLVGAVLLSAGCGAPGDPIVDNIYTQNIYPGTTDTYNIGSADYTYNEGWFNTLYINEGWFNTLYINGALVLTDNALFYKQQPMPIQVARVIAAGKPTRVTRGIFQGFSLPIHAADEELYSCQCIPNGWDGESDFIVYVGGWLDTANNGKNFQLQLGYENWTAGDVIPTTSSNATVETATGTAAQYTSYKVVFTLDHTGMTSGDALGLKLIRIAASSDEIDGEFVVEGMIVVYRVDKLGGTTP